MTQKIQLNLHAASEIDLKSTLIKAGFFCDEESGTLWHPSSELMLLPYGMVTRHTGEMRMIGDIEVPVTEIAEGWHANVLTSDASMIAALENIEVRPKTPQFIWAGYDNNPTE